MGSIGQAVARMLRGFDVNIYYYDMVRLDEDLEKRLGVTWAEFSEVLPRADILSLHCGYNKEAGYLIGEKELALMPEGSILINTARGKLVKEEALIEALESGHLSACGIDTYETEPPAGITALAAFDQVLLSPHIAGVSYEAFSRMMNQAVHNITCFDEGNLEAIKENKRL
jgi:D-3-phosphoglycerate dehydrogenase